MKIVVEIRCSSSQLQNPPCNAISLGSWLARKRRYTQYYQRVVKLTQDRPEPVVSNGSKRISGQKNQGEQSQARASDFLRRVLEFICVFTLGNAYSEVSVCNN
jgi:hypothetical protein